MPPSKAVRSVSYIPHAALHIIPWEASSKKQQRTALSLVLIHILFVYIHKSRETIASTPVSSAHEFLRMLVTRRFCQVHNDRRDHMIAR